MVESVVTSKPSPPSDPTAGQDGPRPSTATVTRRPDTSTGERSSMAAALALAAESSSRASRRRLRRAALVMANGGDVNDVRRLLPRHWSDAFRAGHRANCLPELVTALTELEASRGERRRVVSGTWTYPLAMFAVVTLTLVGITTFAWQYLRPFERDVAEPMSWIFGQWGTTPERTDGYGIYLWLQTSYVGFCSLLLLGIVSAALWFAIRPTAHEPVWSYGLWNGWNVRRLAAREEITRLLSVFVGAQRPLDEAFESIRDMAVSPTARKAAGAARKLVALGDDPRPAFPRANLLFDPAQQQPGLTEATLRQEATLCRLACSAAIEQGLRPTGILITVMTSILIILGFLAIALPGLLHFNLWA